LSGKHRTALSLPWPDICQASSKLLESVRKEFDADREVAKALVVELRHF